MNRLLIILAMLVIPAQAALATAWPYCPHDARAVAAHMLSHGHGETGAPALDGGAPADGGDAGGHCTLCHYAFGTPIGEPAVSIGLDAQSLLPPHKLTLYDPSHLDRIERVPLLAARSH